MDEKNDYITNPNLFMEIFNESMLDSANFLEIMVVIFNIYTLFKFN